jgi:hypothetical protein
VPIDGQTLIGGYSCLGSDACMNITSRQTTISSGSCHGFKACQGADGNISIGLSSCLGHSACFEMTGYTSVSDESCWGWGDRSCLGVFNSTIGSQACVGRGRSRRQL